MDFNIRAISLADSIVADARFAVGDFLGKEVSFRSGVNISLTLPTTHDSFQAMPEPERLLTALTGWTRVYRFPEGDSDSIHVLAAADCQDHEILFYRIDLRQPPPPSRRAPRVPVEIVGGAIMTYEQCTRWLVELCFKHVLNPDWAPRVVTLSRPRELRPKPIRLAWIGPEILEGVAMPFRLRAIGKVYGAEVLHVPPRSYRDVTTRLREALPLDAAIICDHFAPHIAVDAMPERVRRELVHVCSSKTRDEVEGQICTWVELVSRQIEKESHESDGSRQPVLTIMLRGMLSHSKIGQFNHCPKATVLKGVRARHFDVSIAEEILDRNSELFQDTKSTDVLFLWKEHHDGRQYFLNPRRVESVRALVAERARE